MKFIRVAALVFALLVVGTLSAGCTINRSSPVYKQCDSRWGSNRLGADSTICAVGCLMCSVSSGMAGLGKTINGQTVTPAVLNSFLLSNGGYYGNLYVWGTVERFGLRYEGQTSDQNVLRNNVCANKMVILNVNNGGHWVLATGYDGSNWNVNDSGANRNVYAAGEVVLGATYRLA